MSRFCQVVVSRVTARACANRSSAQLRQYEGWVRTLCSFGAAKEQQSNPCLRRNMGKRFLHSSSANYLELANGLTDEQWNDAYLANLPNKNTKFKISSLKTGLSVGIQGFYMQPSRICQLRDFCLVLVKEGEKSAVPSERDECTEYFKTPGVISASYIPLIKMTEPIVIEFRSHTVQEWEALLSPVLQKYSRNVTISGIMEFLLLRDRKRFKIDKSVNTKEHLRSPLIESYLDYIFAEKNVEFCQRALLPYLNTCRIKNEIDLIERVYGRAKESVKMFGPVFMASCFAILKDTKWWRDIYMFRDLLKRHKSFNGMTYATSNIALRNGDYETAFGLLGNLWKPTHGLKMPNFDSFLQNLVLQFGYTEDRKVWERNKDVVESFLLTMAEHSCFPSGPNTALAIAKWFTDIKDEDWQYALIASSDIKGKFCPVTGCEMKKKELTEEEYDYLTKIVLKHILQMTHGSQLLSEETYSLETQYIHTHAQEIRSFLSMMYSKGPFDVVIDGLNLYYFIQRKIDNKLVSAIEMAAAWLRTYKMTAERDTGVPSNILIVFRQHMRKKVQNLFDNIATVWFSGDESADDPFFLYGALLSGKNCKLVTLDILRNIHAILGLKFDYRTVNMIFKWQQIHQSVILEKGQRMKPQYFDVSIQKTDKTWHIPYYDESKSLAPNKWLILKRLD